MKVKILFIILTNLALFQVVNCALGDASWSNIITHIADNADANNRNEFEAAKQAFLNIKEDIDANSAARIISRKWKSNFPEADANALKALKRYPNMTAADVKVAGEKLFKDHEGFINGAGEGQLNMGCRIP